MTYYDFLGTELKPNEWPIGAYNMSAVNYAVWNDFRNIAIWDVHHNLNSQNLIIQCYNTDLELVIPDKIIMLDNYSFQIEFDTVVKGYAYILKSDITKENLNYDSENSRIFNIPLSAGSTVDISHSFNDYPLIQIFDIINNISVTPTSILSLDSNTTRLTFSDASNYVALFVDNDYVYSVTDTSLTQSVTHSLNSTNVIVQLENSSGLRVNPSNIEITGKNTVTVTLSSSLNSGKIIIKKGNKKIYQPLELLNWEIEHNSNYRFNLIQVFDSDSNLVSNSDYDISLYDENKFTIELSSTLPYAGFINIFSGGGELATYPEDTSWVVYTNTEYLLVDLDKSSNEKYLEASNITIGETTEVEFSEITRGKFQGGYYYKKFDVTPASDTWEISHDENTYGFIVQCFNTSNEKLTPSSIYFTDKDNFTVEFNSAESGYVLIGYVGEIIKSSGKYYGDGSLVLSPHYRIEIDLSGEPMDIDISDSTKHAIIHEDTIVPMIQYWDLLKPASKFAHYYYLLAVLGEATLDKWIGTYTQTIADQMLQTRYYGPRPYTILPELPSRYLIRITEEVTSYTIEHDLESKNLIVQCYKEPTDELSLPKVYAKRIEIVDENNITVTFEKAFKGYICILRAQESYDINYTILSGTDAHAGVMQTSPNYHWTVTHNKNNQLLLYQIEDASKNIVTPQSIVSTTINTTTVTFDSDIGNGNLITGIDYPDDIGYYVHTQSVAAADWSVNHNLDTKFTQVQFFNGSYEVIYPDTIDFSNANTFSASFSASQSGYAVVKEAAAFEFYEQSTITITHNYNTYELIISVIDENFQQLIPDSIVKTGLNTVQITFSSDQSGFVIITQRIIDWDPIDHYYGTNWPDYTIIDFKDDNAEEYSLIPQYIRHETLDQLTYSFALPQSSIKGSLDLADYKHTQSEAASTWEITHPSDYAAQLVECYDSNKEVVIPKSIKISGDRYVTIEFESEISGYALLKNIGQIYIYSPEYAVTGITYYQLGNGTTNYTTFDPSGGINEWRNWGALTGLSGLESPVLSGSIYKIREDDTYVYIDVNHNGGDELNITEIGLFHSTMRMVFYSRCKPIYKPKGLSLFLHFKILKTW